MRSLPIIKVLIQTNYRQLNNELGLLYLSLLFMQLRKSLFYLKGLHHQQLLHLQDSQDLY